MKKLMILLACLLTSSAMATDVKPSLTVAFRNIRQNQGGWVIDYGLRYTCQTGMILSPQQREVKMEGWVSNSRVPSHALPRKSSLSISADATSTIAEVIAADEINRCGERLVMDVWEGGDNPVYIVPTDLDTRAPISIAPGAILRVRLTLEHQHILYGDYDPLLGTRDITLTFGPLHIQDVVTLNEQYVAQPNSNWPAIPDDHKDTEWFVSPPDSLHLEAHVPGNWYYRFNERPVRYNTKMRLRFWYLIAAGTEGDCKVRLQQCKDTPISWRMLDGGSFEQCLKPVRRWTKVEKVFKTESEATIVTLEFKIVGEETEVGEMWIDDISLEPVGWQSPGGP
jgi:hypothetical protein